MDFSWAFNFGESIWLTAECPWRILTPGVAFTDSDDGQKFGLPAPLDGESEVLRLLSGKRIQSVTKRETTGVLVIVFGDVTLELLHLSAGYEAWQLGCDGVELIAQGGGNVEELRVVPSK
jgi:hypothetical protein